MATPHQTHFFRRAILNLCNTILLLTSVSTYAADCELVKFTDPGWTDISATNGVATTLLTGLGYKTDITLLGVPIGFESLKNGEIDVFLGNWMPAQQKFIDKYGKDIDIVQTNLEGAKFTLAVPSYVYQAGVTDFEDLAAHSDAFSQKIYGIEPGAPANQKLQTMIDDGDFGLNGWKVVESGEQAMLSQVSRNVKRDKFIVFLAWEPHPMNVNHDIRYLTGGDKYFGPNLGGATIYTVTRKGYDKECPNIGNLLNNLVFSLKMENEIIGAILNDGQQPADAAKEWLASHPDVLDNWLQGVTTVDGKPGLVAVKTYLGLN
ncbi:choline ABC transporter substrate-binding protein [Hahella ganghwensis]|uniref:choline ABC transporter substrate-binding protein n=1 Tax=Hahella ganghwensis TaxID=286420 RepID=UPI000362BFB8|nr:choline ABC transporter substrate-binding protein [Hahella ganghwensis]